MDIEDAIAEDTAVKGRSRRSPRANLARQLHRLRPAGFTRAVDPPGPAARPGRTLGHVLFAERFRPTPRQYLRITQVALGALCAIIVTGAAVRLTGSGLGCTDWPLCEEGQPVAPMEFHAMVEFVNRLITGAVSAAVAVAVLGSLRRTPRRRDLTRWSWVLVLGVVAQIIIGALVTLTELKYSVVAVHFLVSMVLVWAGVVLVHRAGDTTLDEPGASPASRPRWTNEGRALAALGTAVLVTGAMVTSAGKHPGARPDQAGVEHVVERLPLDIGQVTRVHSVLVWLLCALTLSIVWRLRGRTGPAAHAANQLLIVIVAQGAIGYTQYFTGVPALLVLVHVGGATLAWIMTLRLAFATAVTATVPAAPAVTPLEAA